MLIQLLITTLALVALFGVARRFRRGAVSKLGLILWLILWVGAIVFAWNPISTNRLAAFLGVGRGADAVFYISVIFLFYAIFRIFGKIENLEHQLSELVKKIALRDLHDRK